MEINLPTIMGTLYTRCRDGHPFTLLWDYDDIAVCIPDYKAGCGPLIIIQDDEDGTLVITTTDELEEGFNLAPNPNIDVIVETE